MHMLSGFWATPYVVPADQLVFALPILVLAASRLKRGHWWAESFLHLLLPLSVVDGEGSKP